MGAVSKLPSIGRGGPRSDNRQSDVYRDHPAGVGTHLAAGAFTEFAAFARLPATAAPRLGADTDAVLAQYLGLDATPLADLRADGVIAGADDN